jgi:histidyl-tRNA synthetase
MVLPDDEAKKLRAADAPDLFIVFLGDAARDRSLEVARDLRAAGVAVAMEFEDRKMKKAMAAADKSRARYALIIGENEVASGKYGLKNLATGEQESLSLDEIIVKVATEPQRHRGGEKERLQGCFSLFLFLSVALCLCG